MPATENRYGKAKQTTHSKQPITFHNQTSTSRSRISSGRRQPGLILQRKITLRKQPVTFCSRTCNFRLQSGIFFVRYGTIHTVLSSFRMRTGTIGKRKEKSCQRSCTFYFRISTCNARTETFCMRSFSLRPRS